MAAIKIKQLQHLAALPSSLPEAEQFKKTAFEGTTIKMLNVLQEVVGYDYPDVRAFCTNALKQLVSTESLKKGIPVATNTAENMRKVGFHSRTDQTQDQQPTSAPDYTRSR